MYLFSLRKFPVRIHRNLENYFDARKKDVEKYFAPHLATDIISSRTISIRDRTFVMSAIKSLKVQTD